MSLKIVRLEAENFKRLRAVRVTPEGNVIEIAGNNGEGKSSVLDAIWVALKGRSAAPPEPIRQGEEQCYLELDLGKYRIVRRFTRKEGGEYTDFLRVEDPDGLQYPKPQQTLDKLLGAIGFDPFAFVQMKADAQAKELLQIVPLEVDLAELAQLDKRIYDTRRETGRDVKRLQGQLEGVPKVARVPVANADELRLQLASAAETNGAIDRKAQARENYLIELERDENKADELEAEIARMQTRLEEARASIKERREKAENAEPLPDKVDTSKLLEQLAEVDAAAAVNRQADERERIEAELEAAEEKYDGFTKRLEENTKAREAALAKAKMPVEGLGVDFDDDGAHVTFNGIPFVQISTAEQLRVSTAIAMAANPELRVLRISDGALLDDSSMAILQEMAAEHDFQLWIELVRPNEATGIILEDGAIVGQELEPREPVRPRKKAEAEKADNPEADNSPDTGPADEPEETGTMTQEQWDALSPARRAFLSKQGVKIEPATPEGDDDNAS